MGRKEKLVARLRRHPKDFTYEEMCTLLGFFGFRQSNKGATSGSRVAFVSARYGAIVMHRPHPDNVLRPYQVRQLLGVLEGKGLV